MRLNDIKSRALGDLVQLVHNLLEGNFALSATPATLGSSATDITTAIAGDGFTRDVECSVVDSDGNVIKEYNGTLPIAVAVVTAGDGDATLEEDTLTFVDGEATATITYTGTWAEDDTCTFTLGNSSTIGGTAVANKTSVDTVIA